MKVAEKCSCVVSSTATACMQQETIRILKLLAKVVLQSAEAGAYYRKGKVWCAFTSICCREAASEECGSRGSGFQIDQSHRPGNSLIIDIFCGVLGVWGCLRRMWITEKWVSYVCYREAVSIKVQHILSSKTWQAKRSTCCCSPEAL